jgi:hypothetical protein
LQFLKIFKTEKVPFFKNRENATGCSGGLWRPFVSNLCFKNFKKLFKNLNIVVILSAE